MKKMGMAALMLALCFLFPRALGEEIPKDLKARYGRTADSLNAVDVLNVRDAEGNDWCLIAEGFGWMNGYRRLPSGAWENDWSGSFWIDAEDFRLIRESEHGFRAESRSLDAFMRYESRGEGFLLTAWRDGNVYPGTAEIRDRTVAFIPDDGGAVIEVPVGEELKAWLTDFTYLPKTPEDMRARAGIGKDAAAAMMPGWTLGFYEMFNSGTDAEAGFYRIENGQITICRAALESGKGMTRKRESLSVPLSQALLARLNTENADTLLDVSGYGSTFLTADAWDQTLIPIPGRIVSNDLQSNALIALTERDGNRYLSVAEKDENGVWQVRESKPLPENAGLDLFHCGDDELSPGWMQGKNELQCGFTRRTDGEWRMDWAWAGEGDYVLTWYGVRAEWNGVYDSVYAYGTPVFADLFQCDFSNLPQSGAEAAALLDTSGWAAVNNPDPKDRLHLRSEPGKNGDSLGKFYNGTPLRVLEEKGEWVRVRVGLGDDCLEGWMMKQYLAFGDSLRRMTQAFPALTVREEYQNRHPLCIDGKGEADVFLNGFVQVVGIRQETKQWIVMLDDGTLYLTPQSWFWEGNG